MVRAGHELVLTARGRALAARVGRVLEDIRSMMAEEPFEPARFSGRFTVLTADYVTLTALPLMLQALLAEAPALGMDVVNASDDWPEQLQTGEGDLVLGVISEAPAGIYQRAVLEDGFACIMRRGHPLADHALDLETFLAQQHVLIRSPGRGPSAVDAALERMGLKRKVTLRLPHFVAATAVIARTDLIMTLPRRIAEHMARGEDLEIREPPFELPRFTLRLLWHERSHNDPAHRWMRELSATAIQRALG